MAYADKITTMRRMALIRKEAGHIKYEGVNIEGECILKESANEKVIGPVDEQWVKRFAERMELFCVYQDPEDEDYWEPREGVKRDE